MGYLRKLASFDIPTRDNIHQYQSNNLIIQSDTFLIESQTASENGDVTSALADSRHAHDKTKIDLSNHLIQPLVKVKHFDFTV